MLFLVFVGVVLYIAVAIYLCWWVGTRLPRGPRRTLSRATIIALFFSFTMVVSHGVMPVPALPVLISCFFGVCGNLYGDYGFVRWVLFPMAMQWAATIGIGMVWYAITKPTGEAPHAQPSTGRPDSPVDR
jgi:hypothetical protein